MSGNSLNSSTLVKGEKSFYDTKWGSAYLGNSLELLEKVDDGTIDLIVTSPPFALVRQKNYKHRPDFVRASQYVRWFMPFAKQFHRVLKPDGSLVLHLGGAWNPGLPTKSLYHFELLMKLCNKKKSTRRDFRFALAQDFYWFNPAKFPSPAQWVTIKRIRLKDAVDPVWWLSKSPDGVTRADNTKVLWEYSDDMKKLLKRAKYDSGHRPSGYDVSPTSFLTDNNGAIAPNLLPFPNTGSNGQYLTNCKRYKIEVHPARFPMEFPAFFIKLLTDDSNDVILDPFAGSNMTGYMAERLGRKWIAFEISKEYLKGSRFRFFSSEELGYPRLQDVNSLDDLVTAT
jgi:site-specific DNA-methyltransferase (cytosine-N4-specific)